MVALEVLRGRHIPVVQYGDRVVVRGVHIFRSEDLFHRDVQLRARDLWRKTDRICSEVGRRKLEIVRSLVLEKMALVQRYRAIRCADASDGFARATVLSDFKCFLFRSKQTSAVVDTYLYSWVD